MKAIVYAGLAATTVALGLLYAYVDKNRESSYASTKDAAAFLPSLQEKINDAATLRVQTKDKTFEITRGEKGWGLASKGGYTVDSAKVRALLIALKEAEPLEEKTDNPTLYAKIGVEEPDAAESESSRLTVLDKGGAELASLIVGNRRTSEGSGGMPRSGATPSDAYYVRKSGEARSWLVEGKLAVESEESRWLDRTILNIDRARVRAAEIVNGDGERVFVSKAAKDATNFDVANVPEGRELRYAGIANTFGSALSNLTLEDVLPAADFQFSEPPLARTTLWTFDGLRVDVKVEERDAKLYAAITTSLDETGAEAAGAPTPPPPPPVEPAEGAVPAEGKEAASLPIEPPAPSGPSPEEVAKEAEEIGGRIGTWVYVLPTWKKSSFVKRNEELLNEATPPGELGADGLPLEGGDELPVDLEQLLKDAAEGAQDGAEDEVLEEVPVEGGGEVKDGTTPPPADTTGEPDGETTDPAPAPVPDPVPVPVPVPDDDGGGAS